MQVKSVAECAKGSILQYFGPSVIEVFVLSIFEWQLKTDFTVPCFEINADPDQLDSEKPVDEDPHGFHSTLKYLLMALFCKIMSFQVYVFIL